MQGLKNLCAKLEMTQWRLLTWKKVLRIHSWIFISVLWIRVCFCCEIWASSAPRWRLRTQTPARPIGTKKQLHFRFRVGKNFDVNMWWWRASKGATQLFIHSFIHLLNEVPSSVVSRFMRETLRCVFSVLFVFYFQRTKPVSSHRIKLSAVV